MRPKYFVAALALFVVFAGSLSAATFVVPTDEELVAKAQAIVTGTVEGSFSQEVNGTIETVYEIRAERGYKGFVRAGELVRVVSVGGIIGERGLIAPGEAYYRQGERVLAFLSQDARDRWRTTDLTLGRFAFRTSTNGERVLVRDMEDVVGWDRAGRVHEEKVRREAGFLRFVEERTRGRAASGANDYIVDASKVTLAPEEETQSSISANAAPFPAATYTSWVSGQPVRWPNISAGVPFYKRSDQNISGAADGGVSVIQNGLAAWTNECGSVIVLNYVGQIAKASANHDGTNVVEFNDPQQRISGSWGGSGTVGICFISFAGTHSFLGQNWLSITDADVVFQDGFTAASNAFAPAMTHEIGHGLGWRHSNQHYENYAACNAAVEECTTAAIMNSAVSGAYGFTLQPWDVNAAQSVYPGGSCGTPTCTPPSIVSGPVSTTINQGGSTTLSVSANGTAPLSYQWYIGASGNTASPIAGATGPSVTVAPSSTTSYWVRVSNSCGTVNSNAATVTVSGAPSSPSVVRITTVSSTNWRMAGAGDFNADGYRDIVLQNSATGAIYVWLMRGSTVLNTDVFIGQTSNTAWQVRAVGDFDRSGSSDLLLQNATTGTIYVWTMSGSRVVNTDNFIATTSSPNWRVVGTADFNADGHLDLLFQNQSTNAVVVWTMNGLRVTNTENFLLTSSSGWAVVGAADFNLDGWGDVIVRNTSLGRTAVWYTSGLRVAATDNFLPNQPGAWRLAVAADMDNDRYPDVVWQNTSTRETEMWFLRGIAFR